MKEAAKYFVGEHDFVGFAQSGIVATDTVREIFSLDVNKDEDEIIPFINEFCSSVIDLYKKFYQNKDRLVFFHFILDNILVKTNIDEDFFTNYRQVSTDLLPLYVFIACWVYDIEYKKFELCLKKDIISMRR